MSETWRLDSIAPDIAKAFRRATPRLQQAAAAAAAEFAISAAGIATPDVHLGLQALRDGTTELPLLERLRAAAGVIDEEYFVAAEDDDARGRGSSAKQVDLFGKARAMDALTLALSHEPSSLHEAIYEAWHSSNDVGPLARILEALLRGTAAI